MIPSFKHLLSCSRFFEKAQLYPLLFEVCLCTEFVNYMACGHMLALCTVLYMISNYYSLSNVSCWKCNQKGTKYRFNCM